MTTLPADAIPVIDHPEYAITPAGQVWRVIAASGADTRCGPVPRMIRPTMTGYAKHAQSPAVKLSRHGVYSSRTIKSLVRQHFGETS